MILAVLKYLFESSKDKDVSLRFATLKTIIQLVEVAPRYVLIGEHIMKYFSEVSTLIQNANDDGRKMDSLRLYYLMVNQYYVDYYSTIAMGIQDILPLILDFYQYNIKRELKVGETNYHFLDLFAFINDQLLCIYRICSSKQY